MTVPNILPVLIGLFAALSLGAAIGWIAGSAITRQAMQAESNRLAMDIKRTMDDVRAKQEARLR